MECRLQDLIQQGHRNTQQHVQQVWSQVLSILSSTTTSARTTLVATNTADADEEDIEMVEVQELPAHQPPPPVRPQAEVEGTRRGLHSELRMQSVQRFVWFTFSLSCLVRQQQTL